MADAPCEEKYVDPEMPRGCGVFNPSNRTAAKAPTSLSQSPRGAQQAPECHQGVRISAPQVSLVENLCLLLLFLHLSGFILSCSPAKIAHKEDENYIHMHP